MEATYRSYEYQKSFERMNDILNASDLSFEEVDEIPAREKLTYTNGYYVYCSALFADIRGSSDLPTRYQRPTLARIYRSYVSEIVAVLSGSVLCKEIVIAGDCVSGVFDSRYQYQINEILDVAARINSLVRVLNYRLTKRKIDPIAVGIGASYGRALMVKAGHSGSGINDVVWMGDVLNEACKLGNYGSASWGDRPVMVSSVFHSNLNEDYQKLFEWNSARSCYHGYVIDLAMDAWYAENCR